MTIGPGHNLPPRDPLADADALIANVNRWIKERPEITDADMARAAQLQTDQLRATRGDLKSGDIPARQRCLDAIAEIMARVKPLLEPHEVELQALGARTVELLKMIDLALEEMEKRNRGWLDRETARLASEKREKEEAADRAIVEAAKLQLEAERPDAPIEVQLAAKEADQRAADLAREALRAPVRAQVKGDYAHKAMALHSNWKARVLDWDLARARFGQHPDVVQAADNEIQRIANRVAKAAKDARKAPPGFEFYNDARAR